MANPLANILRRQALKKFKSPVPTGLLPLSQIHTAVSFIDVEDTTFDECKEAILSFYKANDIKGDIFFFDFRKIASDELLITSIQTTILKRDLNWIGKPKKEKVDLMLDSKPDLFISLIKGDKFPIEFMASCSNARFKVGRTQVRDKVFDLVISEPDHLEVSQLEIFNEIKKMIGKIQ